MSEGKDTKPQHWIVLDTNALQGTTQQIFGGLLGTLTAGRRVLGYHIAIPDVVLVEHRMTNAPKDTRGRLEYARKIWATRTDHSGYENWACHFLPMEETDLDEVMARSLSKLRPFRSRDQGLRDTVIWLSILRFLRRRLDVAHLTFITNDKSAYRADGQIHPDLVADLVEIGYPPERFEIIQTVDDAYKRLIVPSTEKFAPMLQSQANDCLPKELAEHCTAYLNDLVGAAKRLGEIPTDIHSEIHDEEEDFFLVTSPEVVLERVRHLSIPRKDCWIVSLVAEIRCPVSYTKEDLEGWREDGAYEEMAHYESTFLIDWDPVKRVVRTMHRTDLVRTYPDGAMYCSMPGDDVDHEHFLKQWQEKFATMVRTGQTGLPDVKMRENADIIEHMIHAP